MLWVVVTLFTILTVWLIFVEVRLKHVENWLTDALPPDEIEDRLNELTAKMEEDQ